MEKKLASVGFDHLLVPMSRVLLAGLVLVNLIVAIYFSGFIGANLDQVEVATAADSNVAGSAKPVSADPKFNRRNVTDAPSKLASAATDPLVDEADDYSTAQQLEGNESRRLGAGENVGNPSENLTDQNQLAVIEPPAARECRIWGPESSAGELQAIQASLHAAGGLPELRETQIDIPPDFLVKVGPVASRGEALKISEELKSLQIDNYILPSDDAQPAISVGVFSRKELASKLEKKLTQLGYPVEIEPLVRSQSVYHVAAHVEVSSDLYKSSTGACIEIAQGG